VLGRISSGEELTLYFPWLRSVPSAQYDLEESYEKNAVGFFVGVGSLGGL
jgi:hypothetical protein